MASMYEEYYNKNKPKITVTSNSVAPSNIQAAKALPTTTVLKTPAVTSSNVAPSNIQAAKALTPTAAPKTAVAPKTAAAPKASTKTADPVKPVKPSAPSNPEKTMTAGDIIIRTNVAPAQEEPLVENMAPATDSGVDIAAMINSLNEAARAKAIADLSKARDAQLSNLLGEEAAIKPMYYDKRNAVAATNLQGRRSLSEELAARGEARSGVADEANIRANMSLQGETGLLDRQESADMSDIARRRTGVQNAYESDVASSMSGLEASKLQLLIDQLNSDRNFKLQESDVTGLYNGGQTLAAQNQAFNQNMSTKQYNQAVEQQKLDNLYRQDVFNYQQSRDAVSDSQWQQQMDLDLRKFSLDETNSQINNALASRRISQEDAAQALQWARFNADQDPNSLDNQLKRQQLNSGSSNTTSTVDDFASTINSTYVVSPTAANGYKGSIDKTGVKAYLDSLISAGVNDAIIDSLAARYGIQ